MKVALTLTVAILLTSLARVEAFASNADTVKLDVTYKTTSQGPIRLDLYYPAAPKSGDRFPLVLFTHGGGWTTGDRKIGERGVRFEGVSALTGAGFCVASVDYRLWTKDGDTLIRDCITDAKDALRFLAKNAKEYSLDENCVFTFGDSAGGQIAQMLLLSGPDSFPGDPTLKNSRYRLVAGVSWYGPCDFEKTDLFNPDGRPGFRDRFGARIIKTGASQEARVAAFREVSPVNYLDANSPPLLMMQGDKDTTIPVHHAHYMKERADAAKAPVEIVIVQNSGHNWREDGGRLRPTLDEIVAKTAAFMTHQLKEARRK